MVSFNIVKTGIVIIIGVLLLPIISVIMHKINMLEDRLGLLRNCNHFEISIDCNMSNISTMILEVIIAIILGGVTAYYFYNREGKLNRDRRNHAVNRIRELLTDVNRRCMIRRMFAERLPSNLNQIPNNMTITLEITIQQIANAIENLRDTIRLSADALEPDIVFSLDDFCRNTLNITHADVPQNIDMRDYDQIIDEINSIMNLLPEGTFVSPTIAHLTA